MKYTFQKLSLSQSVCDAVAVFVSQEKNIHELIVSLVPQSFKKDVRTMLHKVAYVGKPKEIAVIPTVGKLKSFLFIVVGIGKLSEKQDTLIDTLREASALVCKTASHYHGTRVGITLSESVLSALTPRACGEALAEGAELGAYLFSKYKSSVDNKPTVHDVVVMSDDTDMKNGVDEGVREAKATIFARDLVNESPQHMAPVDLLSAAKSIAQKSSAITVKSLGKKELEKEGFRGILAVAQGSAHEPYLIHLVYKPQHSEVKKRIAIVGKGITFDSGGLSLKPSQYMENMKMDMAGAAAVLGFFSQLETLKPVYEIHGIIGACENMPSGTAIRPGDVVKAKNGTSIEILNTDAEGRVVLADVLSYAVLQKPESIIDLATLTGACITALGSDIAGVMGNDQKLIDAVLLAGKQAGEKLWQMPLEESYRDSIKSDIADVRNTSKVSGGGTITAALFLSEFVGKTPWAHIDIAGPAWAEKPTCEYIPVGGSGFGVRTVWHFVQNNFR